MLTFLIDSETTNEIIYRYFPEGEAKSGLVVINKMSGECDIKELSDNDKHQRYALKLLARLRRCISCSSFEREGVIAWS